MGAYTSLSLCVIVCPIVSSLAVFLYYYYVMIAMLCSALLSRIMLAIMLSERLSTESRLDALGLATLVSGLILLRVKPLVSNGMVPVVMGWIIMVVPLGIGQRPSGVVTSL